MGSVLTQVFTNIYLIEWEQDLIQHHEVYGRCIDDILMTTNKSIDEINIEPTMVKSVHYLDVTIINGNVLCAHRLTILPIKIVICPTYYKQSSRLKMCTSTFDCDSQSSAVQAPTRNYSFALESQIISIIGRNSIVKTACQPF
ncbi:unnamed protein product [Adineta steineri]|uniref:Uncharacterized protein n=1 Tax=Adineta steineri TaxID=433720 RepID=A0A819K5Z6_9BILA|nr:unnamed protein product [Adineta steineri]